MKNRNHILVGKIYLLIGCLLLIACDNGLDDVEVNINALPFDITILAEDGEDIIQMDIIDTKENIQIANLTSELGYDTEVSLNIIGSKISFHSFGIFKFSFWQKDILTNETKAAKNYYNFSANESWGFTRNTEKKIFNFLIDFSNGRNFYINVFDLETADSSKFFLMNGDDTFVSGGVSSVNKEFAIFSFQLDGGGFKLAVLNIEKAQLNGVLEFDSNYRFSTFKDDQLFVMYSDYNFEMYDLDSLGLLGSGYAPGNINLGYSGAIETQFDNNEMLIDLFYPQPSVITSGPAFFDLETGKINEGSSDFLFKVKQEMEAILVKSIGFTDYKVDIESRTIVASYSIFGGEDIKGGAVYTNFQGDLLQYVDLVYIPRQIIIR